MRKVLCSLAVVGGLVWLAGSAPAEEGHAHQHEHAAGMQTVTGEVVDLACYLSEGAMGPGHRECAEKCIRSGLPVGIKTADKLYVAIGGEHGPANEALAPLAAKQVVAEGTVTEQDGVHLIAIKKVTPKES
ncbi:MAG: hypothetical protein HYZ95_04020 [Candidatus Omnitrophica bacterium]|nr:hypothetical protein [Candidatus Omnitrophota bacterium]